MGTITLVPTRFYLAACTYDAAGNARCPECGGFYRSGHYCRAMSTAIPARGGGFIVPAPSPGDRDAAKATKGETT